jgi:hypothetical protein
MQTPFPSYQVVRAAIRYRDAYEKFNAAYIALDQGDKTITDDAVDALEHQADTLRDELFDIIARHTTEHGLREPEGE